MLGAHPDDEEDQQQRLLEDQPLVVEFDRKAVMSTLSISSDKTARLLVEKEEEGGESMTSDQEQKEETTPQPPKEPLAFESMEPGSTDTIVPTTSSSTSSSSSSFDTDLAETSKRHEAASGKQGDALEAVNLATEAAAVGNMDGSAASSAATAGSKPSHGKRNSGSTKAADAHPEDSSSPSSSSPPQGNYRSATMDPFLGNLSNSDTFLRSYGKKRAHNRWPSYYEGHRPHATVRPTHLATKKVKSPSPQPIAQKSPSPELYPVTTVETAKVTLPLDALPAEDEENVDEDFLLLPENLTLCITIYPYTANKNDEISFDEGYVIRVVRKVMGGWWEGQLEQRVGWFPANHVMPYVPAPVSGSGGSGSAQFEIDDQIGPFTNNVEELDQLRLRTIKYNTEMQTMDQEEFGVVENGSVASSSSSILSVERADEFTIAQRGRILAELLASEVSYLESLVDFVKEFMDPLSRQPWFPLHDRYCMFSNLKDVVSLHQSWVDTLTNLTKEAHKTKAISSAFIDFAYRFSDAYVQYSSLLPETITMASKYSHDPNMNSFLMTTSAQSKPLILHIVSFLHKPMQRKHRYHLIVKDLVGCTAVDDPDLSSLTTAYDCLEESLKDIEMARTMIENREVVRNIMRKLDSWEGVGLEHYGDLLLEGYLKLHESGRPKERQFYLLEKILVIVRHDRSLKNNSPRFRLVERILMSRMVVKSVQIVDEADESPLSFMIFYIGEDNKEKKVTITAFNPDQRSLWMSFIERQLDNNKRATFPSLPRQLQDEILSIHSGHQPRAIGEDLDDVQSPSTKGGGKKMMWLKRWGSRLKLKLNKDGRDGEFGEKDGEGNTSIFSKGFRRRTQQIRLDDAPIVKEPPMRTTSLRTMQGDMEPPSATTTLSGALPGPGLLHPIHAISPATTPSSEAPPLSPFSHPTAHLEVGKSPATLYPPVELPIVEKQLPPVSTPPGHGGDSSEHTTPTLATNSRRPSREPTPVGLSTLPRHGTGGRRRSSASNSPAGGRDSPALSKGSTPSTPSRRTRKGAVLSEGESTAKDGAGLAMPTPIMISPLVLQLDETDINVLKDLDLRFQKEEGLEGLDGIGVSSAGERSSGATSSSLGQTDSTRVGSVGNGGGVPPVLSRKSKELDREIAALSVVAHTYLSQEERKIKVEAALERQQQRGRKLEVGGDVAREEDALRSLNRRSLLSEKIRLVRSRSMPALSIFSENDVGLADGEGDGAAAAGGAGVSSTSYRKGSLGMVDVQRFSKNLGTAREVEHPAAVNTETLQEAMARDLQKSFPPEVEAYSPSGSQFPWRYHSDSVPREWSMSESRDSEDDEPVHHRRRSRGYGDGGMSGDDEESAAESRDGRFGRRRTARKRPSASAIVDAVSDAVKNLFKGNTQGGGHHRRTAGTDESDVDSRTTRDRDDGLQHSETEGASIASSVGGARRMASREGSIGKIGGMVGGNAASTMSPAGLDRVTARKSSMSDIRGFFKPKRSRNSSTSTPQHVTVQTQSGSGGHSLSPTNGNVSSPTQPVPISQYDGGMFSDYGYSGSESGGYGGSVRAMSRASSGMVSGEEFASPRYSSMMGGRGSTVPSVANEFGQGIGVIGKLRMSSERDARARNTGGSGGDNSASLSSKSPKDAPSSWLDGSSGHNMPSGSGGSGGNGDHDGEFGGGLSDAAQLSSEGGSRMPMRAFPIPDIINVEGGSGEGGRVKPGLGLRYLKSAIPGNTHNNSVFMEYAQRDPATMSPNERALYEEIMARYDLMAQEISDLKQRVQEVEDLLKRRNSD
ncbi:Pleckstrin y domain-containing G member 1 [Phlyctochytrium planicorne]|nr:Pleckstrin y domain-containing G member 1 [Phlyctochytrium planicorne]